MPGDAYTILHLTDLHYTNRSSRSRDQGVIIGALMDDLEQIVHLGLKPDLIIFNGDLVNDADEPSIFWDAYENFIEPLLTKTRLTPERLVVAPGNHDVMRSAIRANAPLHREFFNSYKLNDVESFCSTEQARSLTEQKLRSYTEFADLAGIRTLAGGSNTALIEIESLNTVVALAHTAFSSAGGLKEISESDYGGLLISEAQIESVAQGAEATRLALRLFVGHHPREWFKEDCGRPFERVLMRSFHGHFAGHVHITDPQSIVSNEGSYVRFQTGALQDSTVPWNGYSLIRVSPASRHFEVRPRRYVIEQRKFVAANEFGDDGVFYLTPASKAFWRSRPVVDRTILIDWIDQSYRSHFRARHGDTLVGKSLSDVFHEHPMQSTMADFEAVELGKDDQSAITYTDLCRSSANIHIIGDTNYGKSTLIRRIGLELNENTSEADRLSIPVLFDFKDISATGEGMAKAIRASAPGLNEAVPLRQLLAEGILTVLVDDVDPEDSDRLSKLIDFTTENPRCRYIFTSTPPRGASVPLSASFGQAVSFREVTLLPLKAQGIREFTQSQYASLEPEKCDKLVSKIISTLKQAALPPTAFMVSILFAVFDDLQGDTLINEVTLIERFVEYLLKRERTAETARSTFNYGDKVRCLAFVAGRMAERNEYDLGYDDLLRLVEEYIDSIGFPYSAKAVLDRFIDQRIIRRTEIGNYRFYLRSFLEYFIAQRMTFDRNFFDWTLKEERYLSFVHEIEFFCGLAQNQDRSDVLDLVAARHAVLVADRQWLIDSASDYERLQLPSEESNDKPLAEITEQLSLPKLTKQEQDDRIDADLARNTSDQDAYRPQTDDVDSREFLSLALYSSVLRNLEHLPKADKESHLKVVIDGWFVYMTQAFALIPSIVKHRSMRVNGITYRTFTPAAVSDERLARMLMLYLPTGVTAMMRIYLSSEKMVRQVDFDLKGDLELVIKLLRAFMLADLDVTDWPAVMSALRTQVRGKPYLAGAMMWKLNTILKMRDLSPSKSERVIDTIARLYAEQISSDPKRIGEEYSKRLVQLQTALRVRDMKSVATRKASIVITAEPRGATDSST